MNCLIGVYKIIIKIIFGFSIFLPINPPIIRLPIGITSKKRSSTKWNKPTQTYQPAKAMFFKGKRASPKQNLPSSKEAMFPKGEQTPLHKHVSRQKRCSPKGNEPTPQQACFMVCCTFRPLEVRRYLVNALPKGAVNLVPLRTSTSGSVSEVQYTIKPHKTSHSTFLSASVLGILAIFTS